MLLIDKLRSLKPDEIIPQLSSMLDRAQLEISWWGERLVKIGGYEGSAAVSEFARKFLSAPTLQTEGASVDQRLRCFQTWEKMKALCRKSDQTLKKSCLYRFVVPLFEFRPWCRVCSGDPVAQVEDWHGTGYAQLFEFPQDEFQELFPGQQPVGKMTSVRGEYWFATPEMLAAVCTKERCREDR